MLNSNISSQDSIVFAALNFVHSDQAATFTVTLNDYKKLFLCDATGGAITVILPAASTVYDGFTIAVKRLNSGANAVTIDGNASETIDGVTTLSLSAQYAYAIIVCDGTEWFVLSGAVQDASTTVKGIVELATDAEAKAGTDTTKVLTPSNLGFVFTDDQDLSEEGYQFLPGGLIMQWGRATISTDPTTVTFPIAFPTSCFTVVANAFSASGQSDSFELRDVITTTTFKGTITNGGTFGTGVICWHALGK